MPKLNKLKFFKNERKRKNIFFNACRIKIMGIKINSDNFYFNPLLGKIQHNAGLNCKLSHTHVGKNKRNCCKGVRKTYHPPYLLQ